MVFLCFNVRQVPREVLKTAASGLGFQHLPRDLANVNAWKPMFDPYNGALHILFYAKLSLLQNKTNKLNLKATSQLQITIMTEDQVCFSFRNTKVMGYFLSTWLPATYIIKIVFRHERGNIATKHKCLNLIMTYKHLRSSPKMLTRSYSHWGCIEHV